MPGAVVTERQLALWATPADEQRFLDAQCLKFRVSVDDVARTALFLASEEARAITGQSLVVDAGLAQTGYVP
jgi:NAD(P)-dependent dehydrogenase (short-subunit alcohol dehydrogenase family)